MYVQFDSVWKRKFFLHVQKSERLKDKCKAAVFSLKSCLSWPIPVSKNPGGDSKLFSFFILFTINLSSVQGWPQTTREGLLNKCATAMVTARVLCAKAICRFIENEQLRQDFQLYSIISVLSFASVIVFLKTLSRPRRREYRGRGESEVSVKKKFGSCVLWLLPVCTNNNVKSPKIACFENRNLTVNYLSSIRSLKLFTYIMLNLGCGAVRDVNKSSHSRNFS